MSALRTVVVGAGRAGSNHAWHLAEHVPAASVVGVVDADAASARRLAESSGAAAVHETLEQALERTAFDAVVIATPTFTHCELAAAAAAAGKHVFCEKPMAITEQECDDMAQRRRAGRRGPPGRLHAPLPARVRRGAPPHRGGRDRRSDGDQVADARARPAAAVGVGPEDVQRHARRGQLARLRQRALADGLRHRARVRRGGEHEGRRARRGRRGLLRQRRRDAALRLGGDRHDRRDVPRRLRLRRARRGRRHDGPAADRRGPRPGAADGARPRGRRDLARAPHVARALRGRLPRADAGVRRRRARRLRRRRSRRPTGGPRCRRCARRTGPGRRQRPVALEPVAV